MFEILTDRLQDVFDKIGRKGKLTEADVQEAMKEGRRAMLEAGLVDELRYNPTGQPTGRGMFPGFVARSRSHPETELRDPEAWTAMWLEARRALADGEQPSFNRWDPASPACA